MKKAKILFITTQLPYPPMSGGTIKSWRLVEFLSEREDLSLVTLLKQEDARHEKAMLSKINCAHYLSKPLDIERGVRSLLSSYLKGLTLNQYRNYSKNLEQGLSPLWQDADVVFIDHYEMFQYIPKAYQGKIVLHQHNAEHVIWERLGDIDQNILRKWVLRAEARRIKKAEAKCVERSDKVLASPDDLKHLKVPSDKSDITYHLGNDDMLQYPALKFDRTEKKLMYVGTLSWEPNVDGLVWFIKNCWKSLIDEIPELTLNIIGKNPATRLKDAAAPHPNIHLVGFVDDLEPYYQTSRVFIAPLRFGGGIKVKVLDVMYRGIPCVTTSIGVEGLELENGKHIMEASNPEEFVKQTIELLNNQQAWETCRDESRALAKEKYRWEPLLQRHLSLLQSLVP